VDLDDLDRTLRILVPPITGGADKRPAGDLRLSEAVTSLL
jgi:hypothetical protein